MANVPFAEDALAYSADQPRLSLGLHLTLTAGRPLSPPEDVPSLVDAEGRFLILGKFLASLSTARIAPHELERELTAQLAWALQRGARIDHLDSHHHVHLHWRLTDVVMSLARTHNVPYVRCPDEVRQLGALRGSSPRNAARALLISLASHRLRKRLPQRQLQVADHFRGIGLGPGFSTLALLRSLRELPTGVTELMTHPGHPDAELARLTVFVRGRDRELAALTASESKALVETLGIHLTTFGEAKLRA